MTEGRGHAGDDQAELHGPEVVVDVELRSGAFVLVLANTGTTSAFEPRVTFDQELSGLHGTVVVSALPVWTGLALLRPGSQVDVMLDAASARRDRRRFHASVTYADGAGRAYERTFTHDLDVYADLPSPTAT